MHGLNQRPRTTPDLAKTQAEYTSIAQFLATMIKNTYTSIANNTIIHAIPFKSTRNYGKAHKIEIGIATRNTNSDRIAAINKHRKQNTT